MDKPRIAVIDDQLSQRKTEYIQFLSEKFDVVYISSESNLSKVYEKDIEMLIIDLVLDGWKESTENILDRVLSHNEYLPIIMVSQYWEYDSVKPIIRNMLDLKIQYKVLLFLSWKEIATAKTNDDLLELIIMDWKNRIYNEFSLYQQKYPKLLNHNESIKLLQIADMQFGAETDPSADADRYIIAKRLKEDSWVPNIVAICGDISQSGKESEFHEAQEWIDKFSRTLLPKRYEDIKYLVTVGNHDCNFDAFSQYYYESEFNKPSVEFKERKDMKGEEIWNDPKRKISIESVVFSNYISFADNLSSTYASFYKKSHLNIVNDFFLNWGIRIIHLNTLDMISPKNTVSVGINDKDRLEIVEHCVNNTRTPKVFTIIISHHGPDCFGYHGDNGERWLRMQTFITNVGAKLWLCGHNHKTDINVIEIDPSNSNKNIPYAVANSLRLHADSRYYGAPIGYNNIELIRNNGVVEKIKITFHNIIDPSKYYDKEYDVNYN